MCRSQETAYCTTSSVPMYQCDRLASSSDDLTPRTDHFALGSMYLLFAQDISVSYSFWTVFVVYYAPCIARYYQDTYVLMNGTMYIFYGRI